MRVIHAAVACVALASTALVGTSCSGSIRDPGSHATPGRAYPRGVGQTGAHRLSRAEYDATVRDLLGDTTRPGSTLLPEDVSDPFDNDFRTQEPSGVLVEALETAAEQVALRAMNDPATRDRVVGCTPSSPGDAECMRRFIRSFGRLALRRPLADEEVERFRTLQGYSIETNNFYTGAGLVIRAMLQDLEFLYRVEVGTPVSGAPGVYRLTDLEMATRLSYFIWGSAPDTALLDAADARALSSPAQLRAQAERMLRDPRARNRTDRFHALWLGYERLPHPQELTTAMRRETQALIDRVVFERRDSWYELFRSTETFANPTLAQHYGLTPGASADFAWISYGTSGRQGLLSHGSFLSVEGSPADTSPTRRGRLIRTRLMCQHIPRPPANLMVDTDMPPAGDGCKWDRYEEHRRGGCASCHAQMDPIGFGLENFDQRGVYRTHDNGAPQCTIAGQGELVGVGAFRGPAELAERLIESDVLDRCMVQQLYRFAMGHEIGAEDEPFVTSLLGAFRDDGRRFDELVLDLVGDDAFGYRMEER